MSQAAGDPPPRTAGQSAPDSAADAEEVRTYYGQPVVKQPEWTWEIPWYLFTGGMAGASSLLAFGARMTGRDLLASRAGGLAAVGATVSPVLLIADLGRPRRFLNMLRVFKPTSAMSMGSWLVAAYGPATVGAAALNQLGWLPRLGRVADAAAAVLGAGMGTYTAVLVSDSSIPVWHEARRELPFVFAGSAGASGGAAAILLTPAREAAPARRLALAGAAVELGAGEVMRRRLGELAEPYQLGDTAVWEKSAKACTAIGSGLIAFGGARRRLTTCVGAALVVAGSVCQRWAVYRAGFRSAADPKYTVKPQRDRVDRGEGHRDTAGTGATGR